MAGRIHAGPDRTALGISLILGSVMIMAFADAMVKLVSADLTLWQVIAARSIAAAPFLVALSIATETSLAPKASVWALVRSALLVLTWLSLYASLPVLSLSVAAVAIYTNPIITALLSAALIGERVRPRQWAGVLTGFLGVVATLRPGTDAFSWFTTLPLLGAVFYSSAMVLTRSKCRDEAPLALAFTLHASFVVTGLAATVLLAVLDPVAETRAAFPFLLGEWVSMGRNEWGLMVLLAALSVAYFIGVARAYQVAAPPVIATFDYAYLVSAALWGFVFFSEKPGLLTIAGMVLITVAGMLVASGSAAAEP